MQRLRRFSTLFFTLFVLLVCCRKKDTQRITDPPVDPGGVDTSHLPPHDTVAHIQRAMHITVNPNIGGFYEALPPGYDTATSGYPLMIFLHGGGELGDGHDDLPLILKNSIPKMLNEKRFPVSFTVKGETFSFVIISPQFKGWPVPEDVDAMLKFSLANYHINRSRIYMVGMSMGGAAAWEYSAEHGRELAAIVPICGASWADSTVCKQIAANNVPIWAFHNMDDSAVTVNSTKRYVRLINYYGTTPDPIMTLWAEGGHDAWTKATDPGYKENNKNIYQWMLQYVR